MSLWRRASAQALAWPALALVLAGAATLLRASGADATTWDWQPSLALTQPWRAWTCALVHFGAWHLGANLAGCAVVAAFGLAAGCGARATVAWALAWPLGHVALAWQPALAHYGGLSGVLHAGVAVAAWQAMVGAPSHGAGSRSSDDKSNNFGQAGTAQRWIGAAVLIGLAAKIVLEAPWGPPLRPLPALGMAVAPLAHLTGVVAGLLCAAVLLPPRRHR